MALEGQLSDFSLEEILQLIAVQQKSGFLVLKHEREMVFYFDRGQLISTRDRRNPGEDPLETYLRRYGFLSRDQWSHIDYVLQHATLDLTEVLLSENLLDEPTLGAVLQGLAQEQVHAGMKLKSGRYHFTATSDVNSGIRGRVTLDVQGLLMEGARRLDEEPRLLEKLPSLAMTFERGPQPAGELGEISSRLLRLALTGRSLGDIIAQGRTSAFTVREVIAGLCEAGALAPVSGQLAEVIPLPTRRDARHPGGVSLRQPALMAAAAVLALAVGWLRWQPILPSPHGAAPALAADGVAGRGTAERIRLAQLRDDVEQAIVLYHRQHGSYPDGLVALVEQGFLDAAVPAALEGRGWSYRLANHGRNYVLGP